MDLALRYGLLAGAAWVLGYVIFKRRRLHREIVARFPAGSEVRRELRYSLLSLVIFGFTPGRSRFGGGGARGPDSGLLEGQ
ncbi:MAG TPA: hypothetical protein VGF13_09370 [Verrucomicrobiae bacterium]